MQCHHEFVRKHVASVGSVQTVRLSHSLWIITMFKSSTVVSPGASLVSASRYARNGNACSASRPSQTSPTRHPSAVTRIMTCSLTRSTSQSRVAVVKEFSKNVTVYHCRHNFRPYPVTFALSVAGQHIQILRTRAVDHSTTIRLARWRVHRTQSQSQDSKKRKHS
jgi:hypothetical protein